VEDKVSARVTVYSTPWCGYCVRLKRGLERAGIPYEDVDIEADPEAERFVVAANNGNATVPTVKLPDGRVLTNPPLPVLLEAVFAA
jgi:mycoredoxin